MSHPNWTEIVALDNGAKFLNADLHIHTYGGSSDVKDATMTPQAIVESAIRQKLSVIAITDHNGIKNVAEAIELCRPHSDKLLILAGVEVTTANGHLLAYFAPSALNDLEKFLARLDLVGLPGEDGTHTAKSMADAIAEAERQGGICVAAHIDRSKTGFENFAPGFQGWKRDIIVAPGLFGLECDSVDSLIWYSDDDEGGVAGGERAKLLEARRHQPTLSGRRHLAHLQGSDSHSMAQFETASPEKRWTRLKLNDLTWSAFRTAMVDPEARVRANLSVPRTVPRIVAASFEGGFLDGERIHFSNNLNCFIGGRGTGKSTAIRAIGYAFGQCDEFEEYDNCPESIVVFCEDVNGVPYRYERPRYAGPQVKAKRDERVTNVPVDAFRIEYFGQNQLAEIAKDPLKTPRLFQDFLDRHISLRDLSDEEVSLVSQLRENASRLYQLENTNAQLKPKREILKGIETKLKIAEDGKLQEIVGLQNKLTSERSICNAVAEIVNDYNSGISLDEFSRDFEQILETAGSVTDEPRSVACINAFKEQIEKANDILCETSKALNERLRGLGIALDVEVANIKLVHQETELALSAKIQHLKEKGLAGNIDELQQLLKQKEQIAKEISTIEQRKPELLALRTKRQSLLEKLAEVRKSMESRRKAQLQSVNRTLSKTVSDYLVFVKYVDAGITDEFKAYILEKVHGSFMPEQVVAVLAESLKPIRLAELIKDKDQATLMSEGGIAENWVKVLIEKLRNWTSIFDLQVMAKPPRPEIVVKTKSTPPKEIPVKQLSDGQRHTILLAIALMAESNIPLIIDQPEDDLDNAFISSTIVQTLRSIKEMRQVIVVTHNANIAVLGDSELLLPMKRENEIGRVSERGSIDKESTKREVQDILEGGPEAFAKRREMYCV